MAHTETMPTSGLSLEGHRLSTGELTIISDREFAQRRSDLEAYQKAGEAYGIRRWNDTASQLLGYFAFEASARRTDREFSPEEIAETVARHGLS